jgi:hypothetical protein
MEVLRVHGSYVRNEMMAAPHAFADGENFESETREKTGRQGKRQRDNRLI